MRHERKVMGALAATLGKLVLSGSLFGLILVHTIYGLPFTTCSRAASTLACRRNW